MKESQAADPKLYQVQILETDPAGDDSDGLRWKPYRDGQLFRVESAAERLAARLIARGCPQSDVRVSKVTDHV